MPTGFATARIDPEAPKALPPRTGSAAVPEGEPWRALTRPQAPRGGVLLHHGPSARSATDAVARMLLTAATTVCLSLLRTRDTRKNARLLDTGCT
jgi:hypothetical protein